jgi:coenzyme PQQ precursor peptide PqqA
MSPLNSGNVAKVSLEERHMSWKTPKIIEIALGAEINSYACAKLS